MFTFGNILTLDGSSVKTKITNPFKSNGSFLLVRLDYLLPYLFCSSCAKVLIGDFG
jgi:hypothetical protein